MTFTEYLKYQAPAGFQDELIHGEIKLSPSPKNDHQDVCQRIQLVLLSLLDKQQWHVQRDTSIYVAGEQGPRADVFIVKRSRWLAGKRSEVGYTEGVPELVIEVRSASNSEEEFKTKRELCFSDARCLAFWIVDMTQWQVTVYTATGQGPIVFEANDRVPLPTRIAPVSLGVNAMFEEDE